MNRGESGWLVAQYDAFKTSLLSLSQVHFIPLPLSKNV